MKTKHLVIDTAGFVKNLPLWEYGEELYSIPEVITEIRDKTARQRYESLPVPVKMREPQPWAIKFVNQFSKKTGDYAVLSLADLKILALTYELEVEAHGSSEHLRTEPQKCVIEGPVSKPESEEQPSVAGFHLPTEKCNSMTATDKDPLEKDTEESALNNTFDDSQSDVYKEINVVANQRYGQSLPLSPDESSMSIGTSDSKKDTSILWCHMLGIEEFLSDYSYLGGHVPTSDDSEVYKALVKEYPQFRPSRAEKQSLSFFGLKYDASDHFRPLHSSFPSIKRWSYHLSSFSEKERNEFPSSGRDIEDILLSFAAGVQNREDNAKVPELIGQNLSLFDNALQVDLSALSLDDEQSDGKPLNELNGSTDDPDVFEGKMNGEEEIQTEDLDNEGENEDESEEFECADFLVKENGFKNEEEEEEKYDDDDDAEDDDEGWITPSNIKKVKLKEKNMLAEVENDEKDILVACVTSDFAMQNILKHIGLSVMGVDGKIIQQIKTYVLRCYACFKICSDMTKIFCPKCGNKTLKRVSVTVNPDGTQKIWINFKKPINTRGMIFSLPRPKGGQHARNPILVADQKEVRQFSSKMSKKKINPLHEDYDPDVSPFAVRDVYSRAAQLGYMGGKCHNHYYWEQKNPNARTRKLKKK